MSTRYILIVSALLFVFACHSKKNNQIDYDKTLTVSPDNYIPQLDSTLRENSGLISWNNFFWTINDSGGKNEIYGMDISTGALRFTVQLSNARNIDWEDIAQDKNFIYVAETGNNPGNRIDQKIYRIRKKDIGSKPFQEVIADSISFQFADQIDFTISFRKTRYDCEALFVYNDSLFVFTKDWVQFNTKVYGMPAKTGNYSLLPVDSFNVNGLITGADILSDGRYALIGYRDFHPFIWLFKKKQSQFFGYPKYFEFTTLDSAQTEGICISDRGDIFISCEQIINKPQQIWKISNKNLPW